MSDLTPEVLDQLAREVRRATAYWQALKDLGLADFQPDLFVWSMGPARVRRSFPVGLRLQCAQCEETWEQDYRASEVLEGLNPLFQVPGVLFWHPLISLASRGPVRCEEAFHLVEMDLSWVNLDSTYRTAVGLALLCDS